MDTGVTIRRLIGVYNAKGTFTGELAYWIGARLGRGHCALCEITHGIARPRPEWKAACAELPVPFATYHLNDQPAAVRGAYDGMAPVVLAETNRGYVALLGPEELAACAGSVDRLAEAIDTAVQTRGLIWPTQDGSLSGEHP